MPGLEARLVWLAVQGGVLVLLAWRMGALGGRRLQRRAVEGFALRSGLPLGGGPDAGLTRRVVRRLRFVVAGVALGLAIGTLLAWEMLWFALLYAGLALGAVADRLTRPAEPPDAPRVAHSTSTAVDDYVPGWILVAVGAAAAAVVLLAVLWAVAPRAEVDPVPAYQLPGGLVAAMVAGTLGALAASLALARLVVRRRQPAASPADLAVDDAMRAQAVRDALHLSVAMSVVALFTLAYGLTEQDVEMPWRRVGGALPLVVLVALIVVGAVHEWRGGPRHWRRLHPALVGGG